MRLARGVGALAAFQSLVFGDTSHEAGLCCTLALAAETQLGACGRHVDGPPARARSLAPAGRGPVGSYSAPRYRSKDGRAQGRVVGHPGLVSPGSRPAPHCSPVRELRRGQCGARPSTRAGGPESCPRVLQPRWGSWPYPASSPCRPPSSWGRSSTSSTRTLRRISVATWPASASRSAASSCAVLPPTQSASTSCRPPVRAALGQPSGDRAHAAALGPPPPGATPVRTGSRDQVSHYQWPWVRHPPPGRPSHSGGEHGGRAGVCGCRSLASSAAGPLSLCGSGGLPSVPTHPCRGSWLMAPKTCQGQVVPGW